jgi:integrase
MRHNGHIRQRSENSFEIRYSLGNDPVTGKWKVKTVTFKGTRKEAQGELRRILKALNTSDYVEPSKMTTADYLKQWIATIKSQVSPKTHDRYAEIIRNSLVPTFGSHLLNKLSPAIIQSAYNAWETSGRKDGKKGGLSPRTRLHIHRIFSSALKHAVQLQLIARNPADSVKPPRTKKAAITTLTIEQAVSLLEALQGKNIYLPVLLALTTGMRRGEILALRWKHIDFEKKTVRVVESLEESRAGLRFKAPKTERTRAIVLPDYAVEELMLWRDKQTKELAELEIKRTQETLVACRYDAKPLWPSSLTHEFTKAIKKLPDLPYVRFHDLRHSHATQLLMEGVHPKIAQERLGHSTITTTLDLYSHVTDTMQDDAALKLNKAFRAVTKTKPKSGPQFG